MEPTIEIRRERVYVPSDLTDKVDGRAIVDIDCDHNMDCGVSKRNGDNTIYIDLSIVLDAYTQL
jgi:hypothetical protein